MITKTDTVEDNYTDINNDQITELEKKEDSEEKNDISEKRIELSSQQVNKMFERISSIKSKLIIDVPLTLPIIKIKTKLFIRPNAYAATDGVNLYIEPSWFTLPNDQAEGVLYHEWCHICLLHSKRMKNRIHKIWNFACDFFINYHIKHELNNYNISIAPGMLYDSYYNYDWCAEKIYDDLVKEVNKLKEKAKQEQKIDNILPDNLKGKNQNQNQNNDQCKGDQNNNYNKENNNYDKENNKNVNKYFNREQAIKSLAFDQVISEMMADDLMFPVENSDEKELMREIIKAAEMHKKSKGSLPGFFKTQIDKLKKARVPWDQVFHNIFMDLVTGSEDRSFAKPKRWAMPYNIFLPSETGYEKQEVVLILDTSGSMYNNEVFQKFVGEVKKILQYVKKLTIIGSDAKVHEKTNIKNIHELIGNNSKFKYRGGGGTDFRPALELAAKLRSDLVIYYTDGMGTYGERPKGLSKLLWVLTEDVSNSSYKPPFGKYIVAED